MPDTIYQFQGKYRFLSNFFVEPDGSHVEGEYQTAKCADEEDKKRFIGLTPGQCKRLGRRVKIRPDWDRVRTEVMFSLVCNKFSNLKLARLLLDTGDCELIEGNHWNDRFWGKVDGGHGTGENQLGKILMRCRSVLREIDKDA